MNYLNSFLITGTALAAAVSHKTNSSIYSTARSAAPVTVLGPAALSRAVHPVSFAALPAAPLFIPSVRSTSETFQSEQP